MKNLTEEQSKALEDMAYYRGYIRQKMEVQRSIIKAAQNGSNPALEQLLRMLNDISNQLKYG